MGTPPCGPTVSRLTSTLELDLIAAKENDNRNAARRPESFGRASTPPVAVAAVGRVTVVGVSLEHVRVDVGGTVDGWASCALSFDPDRISSLNGFSYPCLKTTPDSEFSAHAGRAMR